MGRGSLFSTAAREAARQNLVWVLSISVDLRLVRIGQTVARFCNVHRAPRGGGTGQISEGAGAVAGHVGKSSIAPLRNEPVPVLRTDLKLLDGLLDGRLCVRRVVNAADELSGCPAHPINVPTVAGSLRRCSTLRHTGNLTACRGLRNAYSTLKVVLPPALD